MSGLSLYNKDVLTLAILRGEIMHIVTNWHIHHHVVLGINAYGTGLSALERKCNKHNPYELELKTRNMLWRYGRSNPMWSPPEVGEDSLGQWFSAEDRNPMDEWRVCPLSWSHHILGVSGGALPEAQQRVGAVIVCGVYVRQCGGNYDPLILQ